jgi:monoamine oxidase
MRAHLTRADVVVVGAGIAGLTAATALADAGRTVVVCEARDRVGGRARSVTTRTGVIDLGATWFWPNEPLTRCFADRLGVDTFPQHLLGDALFEPDGRGAGRLDGNPVDADSTRFARGAQSLAERMADRLAPGTLRYNDPVTAVTVTADGVRVDARTGSSIADHVILAIPPALAVDRLTIAPPLPALVRETAATTAVWQGTTAKAVAVYDQAFWRADNLSGAAISYHGPFREIHDHSGPDGTPAAIFGFAPSPRLAHLETPGIADAFRDQLVRMFGPPAARVREIHVADWSREAFTTPPHPAQPGLTSTFGAEIFQSPVHGRIHWASTETATAYSGHIEGAIRAGLSSANRITRAAEDSYGLARQRHLTG